MNRRLILSLGAAGALATAGGVEVAIAATSSAKVSADAHGALRFHPTKLTAKAGTVRITMMNPKTSGKSHGIAVEGHGVDKDGKIVTPGKSSVLTVKLKKGTYTFYCPVPGHRQAGMMGKLVVS